MVMNVKVDVSIDGVRVERGSYALYSIRLKLLGNDGMISGEYHVYKRFSEFLAFKRALENEYGAELPYELPSRGFRLWSKSSIDPEVTQERRTELSYFLRDLLNDSFDNRWRNSHLTAQFLGLPEGWNRVPNAVPETTEPDNTLDLVDPQQWMATFRSCKTDLDTCKSSSDATKALMQLRLRVNKLDTSLSQIAKTSSLDQTELEKRKNLVKTLKSDINELVLNSTDRPEPFQKDSLPRVAPLQGRRKIGETLETIALNDQQLLQLHKESIKAQDKELLQLHKIVQNQKSISEEMNRELLQQNEMLDMLDAEVDTTATRVNRANRSVRAFNKNSN